MKIRCSKEQLLETLGLVGRTVSAKTPLPILECVLLTADDKGLKLMANDLEMSIETESMEAEVKAPGSVALEAKLFSEIVRKMPEDYIEIEQTEDGLCVCKSGKAKFKIQALPGEEFPVMPELARENGYIVPAKGLREMIRQTIFSVAIDDIKPILKGELIQHKDNALHIVAVDGFRISYKKQELPEMPQTDNPLSVVVPAKALNELSRILSDDEEASVYFTDKRIVFDLPKFTFVSRLLEGEFIRYDQIFNEDYSTSVTINRLAFLAGLERAVLIARENKKSPVKLNISADSVAITSNTETGTIHDEIAAQVDGDTLEIAFNPRYLIEALRALEEEQIIARFTTELSPCIMRGAENDSCRYLILPLRLKG